MKNIQLTLFRFLTLFILSFTPFSHAQTFKIATLSPDGSFWTTTLKDAATAIATKTENRVQFRFYPGGVMGNDGAVLKKMRIGQLQGALFSTGAISDQVPNAEIYTMPLLFKNYAEVDYVRKSMDAEIEQEILNSGLVTFGLAEGGFAFLMSKKPISDANELKQHKVWSPSDDAAAAAASEIFQLSPITLSIGDVLTGLQTDLINTITASPIAAIALQWHTQIKYITDLPIAYFTVIMALDKKAFDKVTPADQKITNEILRAAFVKIDKQNRIDNDKAFDALKKLNISMVTPNPAQLKVWQDKSAIGSKIYVTKAHIGTNFLNRINSLMDEFHKSAK